MDDLLKKIDSLLISVDHSIVDSFRLGKAVIYDEYGEEYVINEYYKNNLLSNCELLEVYCRALRDKLENG